MALKEIEARTNREESTMAMNMMLKTKECYPFKEDYDLLPTDL